VVGHADVATRVVGHADVATRVPLPDEQVISAILHRTLNQMPTPCLQANEPRALTLNGGDRDPQCPGSGDVRPSCRHVSVTRKDLALHAESVLAAILLVSLLPVLAIIALLIICESRGPVLVRSRMRGSQREVIEAFTFRTAPLSDGGGGERFTRVGWLLHRTGLERLPSLWNVLRGELRLLNAAQAYQGS
jgi:hypothetical protein